MSADKKQQILKTLRDLMDAQPHYRDDFPCKVFAASESEFGISTGPQNGGLHAIHHLIDSLEESGFFKGQRKPRSDLDSMMYEFHLNCEVEIYAGAVARRDETGFMILRIKTERPIEETLRAFRHGIRAAEERLDKRRKEQEDYAQMVRDEFVKEYAPPFFAELRDRAFVKNCLKILTDEYFSGNPQADVQGPLPAPDYLQDIFSEYGVTDNRPVFEVTFKHAEENFLHFNEFHNRVLPKIFTAPLAVGVDQTSRDIRSLSYEVRGAPSRLARDIARNAPDLASRVAREMGFTMPEQPIKIMRPLRIPPRP